MKAGFYWSFFLLVLLLTLLRPEAAAACGLLGLITQPARIVLRSYQMPVFLDMESKVLIVDWSRQIGKSFTMANWSVKRILQQLKQHDDWLIVVLSNSKDNGSEFAMKVSEVCRKLGQAIEQEFPADLDTVKYEDMKFEIRIKVGKKLGRIKILAASPRTARGFSGDLILDEFAFHEDDRAIWEAAEPIISANPDFLCRICSTRNGTRKLFHDFATNGEFPVNQVKRSDAWKLGEIKIASLKKKGKLLTPAEAEDEAVDRKAYRQNYECESSDELGSVLTWEQIQRAEGGEPIGFDEQQWSSATLARLHRLAEKTDVYAGCDVARVGDFTCVALFAHGEDKVRRLVGLLKMRDMRLPAQQQQIDMIMRYVRRIAYDCTGLGLGLYEYSQDKHGGQVLGVNFGTRVPIETRPELLSDGRKAITAAITEVMALDLSNTFDDGLIQFPYDRWLRADLHKPERLVTATGRVTIAATRDAAGHADGFWSFALAEHASRAGGSADVWTEEDCAGVITGGMPLMQSGFVTAWGREITASCPPSRPKTAPRPLLANLSALWRDLRGGLLAFPVRPFPTFAKSL